LAIILLVTVKQTNMKSVIKKQGSATSTNTQKPKQNEGVTKGNGTQASNEPQGGRNNDGKDGAKPRKIPK